MPTTMHSTASSIAFRPGRSDHVPGCFVANLAPDQPTLVAVHGISRNAAEIVSRFAAHPAFAQVSIVAPLFERRQFGRYQQLVPARQSSARADAALFDLLEILRVEHGIASERILLFGFSGGAQMVHRMAMIHPERVSRVCAASAGWYLMPDRSLAYPYGMDWGDRFTAATNAFLDVPIAIIAGSRDTRVDGSVRQHPEINRRQGRNRLRRARVWVSAITELAQASGLAPQVSLTILEGLSHDFGLCVRDGAMLDAVAKLLLAAPVPLGAGRPTLTMPT